jgi:hypothetical protein
MAFRRYIQFLLSCTKNKNDEKHHEGILKLVVCILLRVLDQVQGFRLTQHRSNSCLLFYSITATCFGRMTIFM